MVVVDASISGSCAAVSTHVGSSFQIHLLQFTSDGAITVLRTYNERGDITCLCLDFVQGEPCIVAGVIHEGHPFVAVYGSNMNNPSHVVIDLGSGTWAFILEVVMHFSSFFC